MLIALQIIWIFLNAPQKINIMEYILINDSLNCDYNEVINIYVKMFKRKENKLYRIKYTKNTVTNTYNEIHLFHKRFERNRYMCEMWNNKNNNNKNLILLAPIFLMRIHAHMVILVYIKFIIIYKKNMKMRLYNNFMDLQYMVLSTVNKISDDIYYPLSNIRSI
ncbi:hypothetical protein PFNF54_03908 [Plasmodium falciparum NF54]|uniref:Plasmodium falciparum erythrocyte membrane protein 1 acidic terminal segment domain-containing protein n=1 Tax=Plasmodium falciparum (isolate NF54) TaxID=5843 RepID=W7JRD2_PLAFO|nr:hypothetical protein PFNF54_03908 [Plasmodium falciparum NF54]